MISPREILYMTVVGLIVGGSTATFSQQHSQKPLNQVVVKKFSTTTTQPTKKDHPSSTAKPEKPLRFTEITYNPPKRGAPDMIRLEGGGTRGSVETLWLSGLGPNHLGLTSQPQPDLFWYINRKTDDPVQLIITEDFGTTPLVEMFLPSPTQPGIQKVPAGLSGLSLSEGKAYQWTICVIPDPERRSQDVMASGWIQFEKPANALTQALKTANPLQAAHLYAESGFWYDAMAAISNAIDKDERSSQTLVDLQASLLNQVGLGEITGVDTDMHHIAETPNR